MARWQWRRVPLSALGAAAAVAVIAASAALGLQRMDRSRSGERVRSAAQSGAQRASDALRGQLAGFEVQVQNATGNPRLVAALDADVDEETLRDLVLTEPWWEAFRKSVDGFGLIRERDARTVASGVPYGLDWAPLVETARAGRKTASEVRSAAGQVLMIAASPIPLRSGKRSPVLVALRSLDIAAVSMIAERARGAVGISDGRRLLVGATAAGADMGVLRQVVTAPAPGVTLVGGPEGTAVAAWPLAGGLRLLVSAGAAESGTGGGVSWAALATALVGLLASLAVFRIASRRRLPAPGAAGGVTSDSAAVTSSVGRYTLVDRIGQGGMAEIYSAVAMGEGGFRRPLVIKKLRPELVSDPVAVAQFCDEANLLAALHHANIVAVHDFSRTGDQYFLAEEYVLGRNLGQILRRCAERRGRSTGIDGAAVGYVALEVLKALDYAHNLTDEQGVSLGIVHRDVSPANVMISARAEVKLLDFGVVKTAAGTRAANNNEAGVAKGNVTYMSPEHARGADIDSRADLYSLALSLVFCLTGKPLYDAETTYGLLMKAAAGPGPEELAVVNSLPAPFARVLRRALAAHLSERHQTAREMAADLEPAAAGGGPRLTALVTELYGPELDVEARRLSTFSSTGTMVRRVGA
jgi:hypothetical protein